MEDTTAVSVPKLLKTLAVEEIGWHGNGVAIQCRFEANSCDDLEGHALQAVARQNGSSAV